MSDDLQIAEIIDAGNELHIQCHFGDKKPIIGVVINKKIPDPYLLAKAIQMGLYAKSVESCLSEVLSEQGIKSEKLN